MQIYILIAEFDDGSWEIIKAFECYEDASKARINLVFEDSAFIKFHNGIFDNYYFDYPNYVIIPVDIE